MYQQDTPSFFVSDHLLKIIITITLLSLIYQFITVIVEVFDTGCHRQGKQNHCSGQSCVKSLKCEIFRGELTSHCLWFVYPASPELGTFPGWFWTGLLRCPGGVWAALAQRNRVPQLCLRGKRCCCFVSELIWSQPGYLFWELNCPLLLIGHAVTLYKQSCFSNRGFVPR